MDVETLARGRDRTEGFAQERRRASCRGTPTELDLGGLCPFQWNVGLGRPKTSPFMIMTSPSSMDVLGDSWGSFGTCGRLEKPKEG
jgi:hypothetical protein